MSTLRDILGGSGHFLFLSYIFVKAEALKGSDNFAAGTNFTRMDKKRVGYLQARGYKIIMFFPNIPSFQYSIIPTGFS
jgi:hypothetical protein